MMVLCDREGRVYDVWITFGSVHEVRAFRERKKRSLRHKISTLGVAKIPFRKFFYSIRVVRN